VLKFAGNVIKNLWLLAAVLVILCAVVVVLGRELLPVANRYQHEINSFLSEKTGLQIRTTRISGAWVGLTPRLSVRGVRVLDGAGKQEAVSIGRVIAELNLLKSIGSMELVWEGLEVQDVSVTAVEDGDGIWSVAGVPLGAGDGSKLAYVRDLIAHTRFLRMDNVAVNLDFYSGSRTTLYGSEVQSDNSEGFHRTVATLALDEADDDAARLVFEGRGDLADSDDFSGQGFLQLKRINFDGSLSTIARHWFPDQVAQMGAIDTDIDLSLWFDWRNNSLVNGRGTLEVAEVPLNWMADAKPLRQLSADVTAWYQHGEDWGLRLQNLQAEWSGEAIEPLNLMLRQRVGKRWGELDIVLDHLDLVVVNDLIHKSGLLDEKFDSVLQTLDPRGALRNVVLDLDFSTEQPTMVVRGNMADVSVASWRGAPAGRGINGYFEATGREGFIEIDSPSGFAMHYPQVYEDFMPYGAVRGRVDWRWREDRHQVEVASGPISIDGEEGRGTAFLYLNLPTRKDEFEPEMSLMVTLRDSHSRYVDRYLPTVLSPQLRDWLDSAIGDSEVPEAGFIWRGSLKKDNHQGRTIQVYARVENANLNYQPGWPPLSAAQATLLVDDRDLDVWADGARVGKATLHSARARLRSPGDRGPLLAINGQLSVEAGDGLAILVESPIGSGLQNLRDWQLSGASDVALDLAIPLSKNKDGEKYNVKATLSDARLELPGTAVDISSIDGAVNFSLKQGLHAKAIAGLFHGKPLKATIKSDKNSTRVSLDGAISGDGLAPYLGRYAGRVEGVAALTGQLKIPLGSKGATPVLTLESDLNGFAIDLPEPFGKSAEATRNFATRLRFRGADIVVDGQIGDEVSAIWQIRDGKFRRGEVSLLSGSAQLPARNGLLVSGAIPSFDWSRWQPLLEGSDISSAEIGELTPQLDLRFGDLLVNDFSLGWTSLKGGLEKGKLWRFQVESERAAGEVLLGGERLVLRLDYLNLPQPTPEPTAEDGAVAPQAASVEPGEEEQLPEGFLDSLEPADIPALDFAAKRISLGDSELGTLAFWSTPVDNGVRFEHINGTIRGITLGAEQDSDQPELEWLMDSAGHHTRFSGSLSLSNLASTLELWKVPRIIDSEQGAFHMELEWPQRPWEFSPRIFAGNIGLDLEDGQFYRATGVATNTFFRLVSLLNFDTWLRRLRFNFTDLFNQGVSFDRLRGGLAFDNGVVRFDEPIVVSMPSGKIRLLGSADMITEQLDARLVATLPVGTNLPWVAGVLGGLPAAAGVYLTGKLFKKQVDQLSSLSYSVTGSWDDPDLEVDKIFSDKTDFEAVEKQPDESSSSPDKG